MLGVALFFIFGTIVGSFLNVVILRYNTGRSAIWRSGRSSCPICRHELAWHELVPILSFIFLGGRCAKCRTKISWQYPLVEFLTGIIFASTSFHYFFHFSFFFFLDLVIFCILIVIFVYDLRHKIIPDGLVYAFIALSFLRMILLIPNPFSLTLDLLAGPIMFLPFFLLWYISSGRWMGFGDAKLALGIGWFLGFLGALSAIILGFWIGAVVGMLLLLWRTKLLTIKSEIPFAPFLIVGLLLVYFFQFSVLNV